MGVGVVVALTLILIPFTSQLFRESSCCGARLLWGSENRYALALTRRGVALTGPRGEQNPAMRSMMATGDFTKLYLVYATMTGEGLAILSIRLGAVLFGTILLTGVFPLFLILEMLNDCIVVRRLERERIGQRESHNMTMLNVDTRNNSTASA